MNKIFSPFFEGGKHIPPHLSVAAVFIMLRRRGTLNSGLAPSCKSSYYLHKDCIEELSFLRARYAPDYCSQLAVSPCQFFLSQQDFMQEVVHWYAHAWTCRTRSSSLIYGLSRWPFVLLCHEVPGLANTHPLANSCSSSFPHPQPATFVHKSGENMNSAIK